ncbi:MAG TPA: FAD-dependent oxidoreductase [Tepidisphaeraceae bacterium]|nr:FAD-dependent oxidoreductase [Tepidisphaeraceae bacterium]
MALQVQDAAFPKLDEADIALLRPLATERAYADGDVVFRAGDADIDLVVVESGAIDMLNPTDENALIVTHGPGQFAGDIDLLTRRPVIVTAVARGPETRVLRVPNAKLRRVLNTVPRLGEKLLTAFTVRRQQLQQAGVLGMKVVGPGTCRDTTVVREFLYKNFVPFTWYDTEQPDGHVQWRALGSPKRTPAIECGDGKVLLNPTLRDLAHCAGIWRDCPQETFDLAVIGAGPAGIAAAVYAASEGLNTIVLDRLGPGGQAGGSSRIENFIGFPAGLSGADLATRGVLQMLKFGARMAAPVSVEHMDPAPDDGAPHALHLDCGATVHAQTVLVATGVRWRKLGVPGADRFERQGIYYACTAVEAYLHQGHDVAVVGAGNSAGQAVMFLAENCARRVHMLIRRELGPGMSDYLVARIRNTPNVTVHNGVEIAEVHGRAHIDAVTIRDQSGATSELPLGAIFVFIGAEPHANWLPDTVARDELGYLLTGPDALKSGRWPLKDREPCPLETTLPGVLAGGDVRAGSTKRVGFAVGDGSLAVTCCHRLRTVSTTRAAAVAVAAR